MDIFQFEGLLPCQALHFQWDIVFFSYSPKLSKNADVHSYPAKKFSIWVKQVDQGMHQYIFQYIFRLFVMKVIANVKRCYDHKIKQNVCSGLSAVALLI